MEEEFIDIDKRNAWGIMFQEIRSESSNFSYIIKDAKKSENKNLNRYRDVNPFDHSRVRLQRGDKDYINASLVKVPCASRAYILTQGPLPLTMGHFWLMVWEQKSRAILMLNRVIEKNAVKCHHYWPVGSENDGKDDLLLEDVSLKITFLKEKKMAHFTVREFVITDLESDGSRKVLQFHYTTWPDFGVPESPAAFLNFLFEVQDSGVLNSDNEPPIVHCSAGIGRSGTFCLVDSCLVLIKKNGDPNCVNICQTLLEMRRYRMGLIQTPDQLRFSYLAVIEGAKRILTHKNVPLKNEDMQDDAIPLSSAGNFDNSSDSYKILNFSDVIPPPLPPRLVRGTEDLSATSKLKEENKSECNGDVVNVQNDKGSSPVKKQINPEPKENSLNKRHFTGDVQPESSNSTQTSNPIEGLLRKRTRKEREERTALLVQNIKKKQKESELWRKRRSFIKLSLGLVLIIGFGYFVIKNYSKN